ncbi:MAG: hypothetical protein NVS3B21_03210 [Acidimicrobiales bacterium]
MPWDGLPPLGGGNGIQPIPVLTLDQVERRDCDEEFTADMLGQDGQQFTGIALNTGVWHCQKAAIDDYHG